MTARSRAIATEIAFEAVRQAEIERGIAIRAIAQAIEALDICGAEHMGHLSYTQALRFHRATEKLHDLMFELEGRR